MVIFLGAGCIGENAAQNTNQPSPATSTTKDEKTTSMPEEPSKNIPSLAEGIVLNGTVKGNRTIELEWVVAPELAEQADKYYFTLDSEPNPTAPGRYWYWRGPTYRELTWTNLPIGQQHIRVCVMAGETCIAYSNDLAVEIK
ncbi:MAG TPA: hypothetical protein DCY48_01680 [Candidatus Magasanikbacteria bacterium]|nr:MAG: hypothetical protein A3I74_00590 [Candidatus Magasanikbacteria bacterium RIFCSPLOWO2_02_FULL_47_16]OGH82666.1 MAG: hypothetical protein A3G08_03130 [Candidatus Magasanikbacteria bacterium RIFCSPLOWO2_12_FULL_47_9b]HAZ28467.1 hypothetical protein [Candidatus Magasanikbacteria bacterium]